jgi:hypothetical protein
LRFIALNAEQMCSKALFPREDRFFRGRSKPRKSDHKRRPGAPVTAADVTRNSTDRQQAVGA